MVNESDNSTSDLTKKNSEIVISNEKIQTMARECITATSYEMEEIVISDDDDDDDDDGNVKKGDTEIEN